MAKLIRVLKLNDRFDSQVFTFILPSKLVMNQNPDTYPLDFIYGFHKWTAFFTRTDLHFGCFLKLQTVSNGMLCRIDFSFTLLNRENFTKNETFMEKGCIFTMESNQHGRKTFVGINDLLERNFTQVQGDYLIQLEMKKISCTFDCYIRLSREPQSRYAYDSKLESPYFSYALFDWSISFFPKDSTIQRGESIVMQLHRHTSFDHICNARYYVTLGEDGAFQSEELDQLVDVIGNGEMYTINSSLQQLTNGRSSLKMKVTMLAVVSISEVTLNIASRSKSRASLHDKDKQAWLIESDTSSKCLTFRLYYADITHVPRKFSRFVSWNLLVLTRYIPEHKVTTNYGPFSKYYVQQDLDDGFLITTSILVDELQDPSNLYTEPDDPRITVHIEWIDSHLLSHPNYHALDDLDKQQKHQMRREILALQSENLVLEKQLHSYQMSLSKTSDKLFQGNNKEANMTRDVSVTRAVTRDASLDVVRDVQKLRSASLDRKLFKEETFYHDKSRRENNTQKEIPRDKSYEIPHDRSYERRANGKKSNIYR